MIVANSQPLLRLGTRGSPLALWQARAVADALRAADGAVAIEIVVVRTTGDQVTDRPLAEIGGKGLFTKELDTALIEGAIDLAVHSLKDVPTHLAPEIILAACLERADPRDCLIAGVPSLEDLPSGAVVGTCSPRRAAQVLALRPDITITPLRGNVDTRLAKIADGAAHATLLAHAGLARLGLLERASATLDAAAFVPAVAQGCVGVTVRTNDTSTRARLAAIDHGASHTAITAERALLAALDGSCRTPIGGYARLSAGEIALDAIVVRPDGRALVRDQIRGSAADAARLGTTLGQRLAAAADPSWFEGPR